MRGKLLFSLVSLFFIHAFSLQNITIKYEPNKSFAYVSIFYEVGVNDYEYCLATRVLFHSLKSSGSTAADFVVLVSSDISPRFRELFLSDGLKIVEVPNIEAPQRFHTRRRFLFSLNKLQIWALTRYDRVIFFDADCIALQNPDFLFQCGDFCAVFFNPVSFHTSILVVRPNISAYTKIVDALVSLDSFDGADQGFLNSYFPRLEDAPLFRRQLQAPLRTLGNNSPSGGGGGNNVRGGEWRLPVQYHMHHLYFYERMSWGGVWGGVDKIVTMTYPIAPSLKPWVWWTYPWLTQHFTWHSIRVAVEAPGDYAINFAIFIASAVVFLAHRRFLTVLTRAISHLVVADPCRVVPMFATHLFIVPQLPYAAYSWTRRFGSVMIGVLCFLLAAPAAALFVPPRVPYALAWPTFLLLHFTLMMSLLALLRGFLHTPGCAPLPPGRGAMSLYFTAWAVFFVSGTYFLTSSGITRVAVLALTFYLMISLWWRFLERALFDVHDDIAATAPPSSPLTPPVQSQAYGSRVISTRREEP